MLNPLIAAIAVLLLNLAGFSGSALAEPTKEDVQVTSIKFDSEKGAFILKTKDGEKTLKVEKEVKLTAIGKSMLFPLEGEFEEWPPIKCPPPKPLALTLVTDGDKLVE